MVGVQSRVDSEQTEKKLRKNSLYFIIPPILLLSLFAVFSFGGSSPSLAVQPPQSPPRSPPQSPPQSPLQSSPTTPQAQEKDSDDLSFTVENYYNQLYGSSGTSYPWITFPVVEPYKTTYLEVSNPSSSPEVEYTWTITTEDGSSDSVQLTGSSTSTNFTSLAYYIIKLEEYDSTTNEQLRSASQRVVCRYVRREIRTLTDDDREDFFSAVETLMNVPNEEGKQLYGSKYGDMTSFVMLHNIRAGDIVCDHMHDGFGFMTSHSALTLAFEQSLQSVNPSVTVPYWDYTIDTKSMQMTGDSIKDWYSSIVFDDDWFGEAAPTGKVVTRGRFAYIPVTKHMFNITSVHNAYGYLRAPWNQNKIPYVTRSDGIYGFKVSDVPSCTHHYDLLQMDHFQEFATTVPYAPHGAVHIAIGGIWGADWVSYLEEWGYNMTEAETWGEVAFSKQKNIYRLRVLDCPSYCSFDTSNEDCKCSCPNYESFIKDSDKLSDLIDLVFGSIDDEYHVKFLSLLCNKYSDLIPRTGDQLESASPSDPSFWPIHPTVDRLFAWKRINGFDSMSWRDDAAWSVNGYSHGYCMGHNLDDVIGFSKLYEKDDGPYSNQDLLVLSNPEKDHSPFIYDNFLWEHCTSYGYPDDLMDDN